jgi:hypothetical protein
MHGKASMAKPRLLTVVSRVAGRISVGSRSLMAAASHLPTGTPAGLCSRRFSAASASRSGPGGPQDCCDQAIKPLVWSITGSGRQPDETSSYCPATNLASRPCAGLRAGGRGPPTASTDEVLGHTC